MRKVFLRVLGVGVFVGLILFAIAAVVVLWLHAARNLLLSGGVWLGLLGGCMLVVLVGIAAGVVIFTREMEASE